jgi:uncharacterized protein (DUF1778 family)
MVRKPKAERKEMTLRFRVTTDQRETLIEAARREGMELSPWLRRLALREAGWQPAPRRR